MYCSHLKRHLVAVSIITLLVQREENVLAQEAVLDALLRSEEQENPWRWGSEGQLGAVGVGIDNNNNKKK